MINGVLFDLDGTLVKLPTDYKIIQDKLRNIFQTTDQFSPLIPSIITNANGDKSKINEAFEIICEQEMIAIKNLNMMQGIKDVMSFLKEKNCLICLITMQCRKAAIEILNKLGIKGFFSNIVTRDESYDRVEQIKDTLKKIKLDPEQVLVIGDTIYDMKCAKKIGCQRILFNNKNESDDDLKVIKNLSDIKAVIDK